MQNSDEKLQKQQLKKNPIDPIVSEALTQVLESNDFEAQKKGALIVAEIFGAADIFSVLIEKPSQNRDKAEKKLIESFHKNSHLLLQKTWVEKTDEALKEQLLYQLDIIAKDMGAKKYKEIYESFLELLHDVIYLLFGAQSKKEEFEEYAFRIDPDFGIFWWFLKNVPENLPASETVERLYILLGMCFLANY